MKISSNKIEKMLITNKNKNKTYLLVTKEKKAQLHNEEIWQSQS